MRILIRTTALSTLLILVATSLMAQAPVRSEDHFWRKRVVNRISLIEKINRPLIRHESAFYSNNQRYAETQGMVVSLINGVKQGKYVAYHPEDWEKRLGYEDLRGRMLDFDQAMYVEEEVWESSEEDTEKTISSDFDTWDADWTDDATDEWGSPFEKEPETEEPPLAEVMPIDYGPYEEVIHMVEDWVFDRNTSSMIQQIDFFEIIWVDPSGTLPEKVLARFKWKDIQDHLDQTMWKARFNDAEARSLKEVFTLRLFHGFPINIGGEPIMTLAESKRRKQEIIDFEHHLWSY